MFDTIFHFADNLYGCGIYFIHSLILVTRCITGKLAVIQNVDKGFHQFFVDTVTREFLLYVVFRKL